MNRVAWLKASQIRPLLCQGSSHKNLEFPFPMIWVTCLIASLLRFKYTSCVPWARVGRLHSPSPNGICQNISVLKPINPNRILRRGQAPNMLHEDSIIVVSQLPDPQASFPLLDCNIFPTYLCCLVTTCMADSKATDSLVLPNQGLLAYRKGGLTEPSVESSDENLLGFVPWVQSKARGRPSPLYRCSCLQAKNHLWRLFRELYWEIIRRLSKSCDIGLVLAREDPLKRFIGAF